MFSFSLVSKYFPSLGETNDKFFPLKWFSYLTLFIYSKPCSLLIDKIFNCREFSTEEFSTCIVSSIF